MVVPRIMQIMELKPDDYILAYWMASDNENNNWYMMVWKSDDKWNVEYTFRYCKDDNDDPWSGKDEKSVYNFYLNGEKKEETILETMNNLFGVIKLKYNAFNDFFLVQGDFDKFKKIASTKDYLHMKVVKTND